MACGDPRTCLHCAMADLVNERIRTGAISATRAYEAVLALQADLISADADGPKQHRRLIENVTRELPPAVNIMRRGGWPCEGGLRPRIGR